MRNQSFVVTTTSFSLSLLFCSFYISFLAELLLKTGGGDFPDGPVVKNPPCNAKDTGLIPGLRTKIPHAVRQLSPRVPTTKAHAVQSPSATTTEACAP